MDEQRDVVVIGGGLAGLAAAATAAADGSSVLLVDPHPAANRAGTDQVGRYRLNRGAHALYRTGAGRAVLRRLDVPVHGRRPPLAGALGRRGDVVDRLPLGPVSMARSRLVPARGLAHLGKVLAGMPGWRPGRLADRTAAAWFDELGLDGAARELVEMLARTATYAADLDRVSADLVARQVRMALAGSVLYLHGGWSSLVDGLAAAGARHGVERRVAAARSIEPDGGRVRVMLGRAGEERVVLARAAVVAAGTPEACAALLPARPPAWAGLGPPVRVSCLDLGLAAVPEVGTLLGLDRPLYLIRHSPPARLAPTGGAVVHAMRYLKAGEESAPGGWRAELEAHCRLAGIDPDAAEEGRYLHRMVVCGALPTPDGGGLAGRAGVSDTGLDRVFVAGDWLGPDGHLGDAALATGEAAGRRAAEQATGGGLSGPRGATMATHG